MQAAPGEVNGRPAPPTPAPAAPGAEPDPPENDPAQLGTVRIARRVLRTVVEQAALSVPGVARMAQGGSRWPRVLGRPLPHHGVGLDVRDDIVAIDLYLIVEPGAHMVTVGAAAQEAVGAAVEHILGMGVSAINVYVRDVA
ncbi:MAG: Asp23/Gls24 family envelope stress response protein [Ktedonobacterales bacterium]|nr:Asp23/Gls24 family envelope stress response protein [Ktedonobacterales bacterium]